MIDGLSLEYVGVRAAARLAWRPDAALWRRLHAARDLRALLDVARAAPVGAYISGVAPRADCNEIDLAFRAQWRARVDERAGFSPARWRAALRWCAHLADLSAVAHLWSRPGLPWMAADPVLAPYAQPAASIAAQRARLRTGVLAPLGNTLARDAVSTSARARPGPAAGLPPVLAAWLSEWQRRWPPTRAAAGTALPALRDELLAHRARFAHLPVTDTTAARDALAARLLAHVHADPAQPLALFAGLALLALDLERLRAECLRLAVDAAFAPAAEAMT